MRKWLSVSVEEERGKGEMLIQRSLCFLRGHMTSVDIDIGNLLFIFSV